MSTISLPIYGTITRLESRNGITVSPNGISIVDFTLQFLFQPGDIGALYEPSRLDTGFTTSALTTQAEIGDPIGGRLDVSGNGLTALQATATARPKLATMPFGRFVVNELDGSESLATQSITVTAAQRTLSFKGTGTVTLSGASTAGPLVGTGADDIVTLTFTPTAGTLTITVSGTVTEAQLERGASRTAYQNRIDADEVYEEGLPNVLHERNDLADDNLPTDSLPAGTYYCCIIAAGVNETGVVYYSEPITHAGGAFDWGPGTHTGGPSGLFANVLGGRIIGKIVIDREFTDEQKASIEALAKGVYGVANRAGWGEEQKSNFDFATGDLTGWVNNSAAPKSVTVDGSNNAVVSNGGGTPSAAELLQGIIASINSGDTVLVDIQVSAVTSVYKFIVAANANILETSNSRTASRQTILKVTDSGFRVAVGLPNDADDSVTVESISVRKLTLTPI